MTDHYDAAHNSRASWALAVLAIREMRVRAGEYEPRTGEERRQAAEGPVTSDKLGAVRCA